MKRNVFLICGFLIALSSNLYSTPDRSREVIDNLIGYLGDDIIIMQYVYDNNGSHYDQTQELYMIIKTVENSQLKVKSQQKINNIFALQEYFSNPNFYYAMPNIVPIKYIDISVDKKKINYLGTDYDVGKIMPPELNGFIVDHIEGTYANNDHTFIVLILSDKKGIEMMRKVFLLK